MRYTPILFIILYFLCCLSPAFADETNHDRYYHIDMPSSQVAFTEEEKEYIKNKKSIVMCTDPDWMPYEKFDKNGQYIGVAADYHKIISHLTGLDYDILQTSSWSETISNAKAGKCDILSILNSTPERLEYLGFTKSYIESPSVFVTRENDKFINGITDLQGKTLAIVKGYMVDEIISRDYPDIERIYAPNIAEALRMVSKGKAFATVGSLLEMSYNIRQLGMLNLKITGDAKLNFDLKIGVRKDEPILLSVMDKALESITKTDRDKILNKWVSISYHQSYDYSVIWKVLLFFIIVLGLFAWKTKITSKYNSRLLALNKDLIDAKKALEEANRTLEMKVAEETAKRLDNERLLMQQSKLAAMGDMIGAIAHQWRQPLSAVAMLVQDIEDAYQSETLTEDQLSDTVKQTMAIIMQMSETINDFSNFFKPDKNRECFKICKTINDVATMFMPQLKSHGVTISLACMGQNLEGLINKTGDPFTCCSEVCVKGYPNEFKHTIVNIVKNAMDALDTKNIPEKYIRVNIENENNEYATITISDNGGGINDDVTPRIFEPYFSTKQQGKGVGIGLYMSKQIIENMNGKIWFENKDGGAAFYIRLKLCSHAAETSIKGVC